MSELPAGWAATTLGEMVQWGSGGTPRRGVARYYGGPIPWAIIGDLNDGVVSTTAGTITDDGLRESSARLVPPGTVLVAMYGSIGKLGIARIEMATNQAIAFADPRQGLDSRFLFWYLRAQRRDLAHAGKGATQKNISQTVLKGWPIPLPPLNEQRRIVAAIEEQLSRLDAAAASLKTATARARRFRDALLENAFGNHAPRRTIGEVAALSDGPFGSNLKTSHYVAAGPRVIRLQNIGDGFFRDEKAHITQEHFDRLSKHAVVPGDVVVASLGDEAPRACLVPEWLGEAIVKADCIRARPQADVAAAYLMWALNSRPVKAQAAARIKGIGRPRLGLGGIRNLEIPLPPLEEQRRIVAEVEERLGAIDALRAAIERAQRRGAALRRSVLERAFRGELVPQDTSDEPASVLLDRIRAERAAGPVPAGRRRKSQ